MRKARLVTLMISVVSVLIGGTAVYANAVVNSDGSEHIEPTSIVYVYDDSGELTSTYQAIVINTKADGSMVIYDCEENKNITLMNSMIVVDKYSDRQLTASEESIVKR